MGHGSCFQGTCYARLSRGYCITKIVSVLYFASAFYVCNDSVMRIVLSETSLLQGLEAREHLDFEER